MIVFHFGSSKVMEDTGRNRLKVEEGKSRVGIEWRRERIE